MSTDSEMVVVNFGALPALPPGWFVAWHPNIEMYMGHGPDEWESLICWNRYWVRRWCMDAARQMAAEGAQA